MINCPNCGTENRDHSKFCNECGHPLGQGAGVMCTMCGAKNAPDSVVCGECGARLVPLEGATEETIMAQVAAPDAAPLSETPADAGLPDWLEGLRDAAQHGVTGETKDLSAQDEPLDEDFLPTILPDTTPKDAYQVSEESEPAEDWLSRLRKAAPPMEAEEAPPTPGPFVEEPEESPVGGISAPFEAVQDEAEDLPDWLSELRNGLRKEEELEAAPAPEIPAAPAPAERDTGGLSWLDEVVLGDVIPATPEEEYEAPAADIRGEPASGGAIPEPDVEKAPIFSAESDTLPGELDSWDNEQLPPLERTAEIPDWLKEMGPFDGKSEMQDASAGHGSSAGRGHTPSTRHRTGRSARLADAGRGRRNGSYRRRWPGRRRRSGRPGKSRDT